MMKNPLTLLLIALSLAATVSAQTVNFSPEYRKAHQGKFVVLVPETHELANIMLAISRIGQEDKNMIRMETQYHKEVMDHFLRFQDHPAIRTINQYMTEVFGQETYHYYYNFRMNACGYEFQDQSIVNSGVYDRMAWWEINRFAELLPEVEDFAAKSGFRKFYADHLPYYTSLIQLYHKLCPVDKMWRWVEAQFPQRYQGYKVIFSPLVYGAHSTNKFADNGYSETVMFVSGPEIKNADTFTDEEKEAILSRIVFTEIDHNYVNPTTEGYDQAIAEALANVDCWNTKAQGYNSPMETFNEYMTWAVFSLYLRDTFSGGVFTKRNEREATFMVERRGFKKFREFNAKLLELYATLKEGETVYDLHAPMVEWVKQQKCKE